MKRSLNDTQYYCAVALLAITGFMAGRFSYLATTNPKLVISFILFIIMILVLLFVPRKPN